MIDYRLPSANNLFQPVQTQTDPQAFDKFVQNIAALQDPSGTLERLQAEQVIQKMADIKTEGLVDTYRGMAIDAINDFQKYSVGLYRSRKGFNRLTLDAKQQLDEDKKYRELLTYINGLQQLSKDYNETLKEVGADVKNGIMTPEAYQAFEDEFNTLTKGAKSIGDLPFARAVYNKHIAEKYDWKSMYSEFEVALKDMKPNITTDQNGNTYVNKESRDVIPLATNMYLNNPRWRDFWTKVAGGDPMTGYAMASDFASQFNYNQETYAGHVPAGRMSYEEWKQRFDYAQANKGRKRNVIPRDADATGFKWDLSSLGVKPKFTGDIRTKEEGNVSLKNADIISIYTDGKQAWMIVRGQKPGDTKGNIYEGKKPLDRSVIVNLRKQGYDLDGWDKPLTNEFGGTVPPATQVIYIGADGNEYTEDQLIGIDIEQAIEDKQLKRK